MLWKSFLVLSDWIDYFLGELEHLSSEITDNQITGANQDINNSITSSHAPYFKNSSSQIFADRKSVNVSDENGSYEVDTDNLLLIPPENTNEFILNNKEKIYKHSLERYRDMIENDLDRVEMFLFGNSVLGIPRSKMMQNLKNILDYWVDIEKYELAKETKDLIQLVNNES